MTRSLVVTMLTTIEVGEADVRKRGADLFRVEKLLAVAETHRGARIEDEVDREILFFFEQANEESVEPLIDVPNRGNGNLILPAGTHGSRRTRHRFPLFFSSAVGRPASPQTPDELTSAR